MAGLVAFFKRQWRWTVALPLVLIVIGVMLSFPFGGCQWTRLHYMTQMYLLKHPDNADAIWIPPPANFTGVWYTWYDDGSREGIYSFRNGMLTGNSFYYLNSKSFVTVSINNAV